MLTALIQTDIAWNEPEENVSRCRSLAHDAIAVGARLLVFPEMFTSGFSFLTGAPARQAADIGMAFLSSVAKEFNVFCIASMPAVSNSSLVYNQSSVVGPRGPISSYQKIHLFSFGDEQKYYASGSTINTVDIEGIRVTVFICYDLRFPQIFAQAAAATDVFVVVANWPAQRREHWLTLLRARAIENQAYVVGVNRVGEGGGLSYSGDSGGFNPSGDSLCSLGSVVNFKCVEISAGETAKARLDFPTLRDRRSDIYENLAQPK